MPNPVPSEDDLKRKLLFVPCTSREQLHRWIQIYLGLDMPDCIVDPDSNSSPMHVIWEVYEAGMKTGKMPFSRILAYASRDSFKTLGASILEVLAIVHMRRSVAHMAAIEPQAQKAVQYVKDFLNRPYLREFVTQDNKRNIEIRRYSDKVSGFALTPKQWEALPSEGQRNQYDEIKNYLQVVICTPRGANSAHVPFFVVDEVDLAEPKAYEEAKLIPAPYQGRHPITLLTSTRKISYGLVQKEIDKQLDRRTGRRVLEVRHWNIVDVTEACPAERHQPEKPKLPIYYSLKTLQAMREADYDLLSDEEQRTFQVKEGYEGCLSNCTLFAICQGRLATEQKSKSSLLKPIDHVIQQFFDVSINTAQAQLMCWKPSTEGLIYPNFDRGTHMMRPFEIATKITGEKYPESFSKADLIMLMKSRDITFHSGMDFGFTHNFAVVTAAVDGGNVYIIDVIAVPGIELMQKIELCKQKLSIYDVSIYADEAYPSDIKSFSKAGFRIRGVKKDRGSVVGGIEIVRSKLMPARGKAQLYLLAGDEGTEILAQRMGQYHWKQDAGGNMTDIPDEKEDDECDAIRYLCMSLFSPKGKFMNPALTKEEQPQSNALQSQYTQNNWMRKQIQEHIGEEAPAETDSSSLPVGKRGGFSWSFG
jgi:hypothetical protein